MLIFIITTYYTKLTHTTDDAALITPLPTMQMHTCKKEIHINWNNEKKKNLMNSIYPNQIETWRCARFQVAENFRNVIAFDVHSTCCCTWLCADNKVVVTTLAQSCFKMNYLYFIATIWGPVACATFISWATWTQFHSNELENVHERNYCWARFQLVRSRAEWRKAAYIRLTGC